MTDRVGEDRPYISTAKAIERLGFTRSYITYLLREKKIKGFLVNNQKPGRFLRA